jgi:hypothetical protein
MLPGDLSSRKYSDDELFIIWLLGALVLFSIVGGVYFVSSVFGGVVRFLVFLLRIFIAGALLLFGPLFVGVFVYELLRRWFRGKHQ